MKANYLLALIVVALLSPRVNAQSRSDTAEVRAILATERSKLKDMLPLNNGLNPLAPDAEIYFKAVDWALRFESTPTANEVKLMRRALERGDSRLSGLARNRAPWVRKRGTVLCAYRSDVDGSVQPYGLVIPAKYDFRTPIRLDVVLHGSTRPTGTSTLQFVNEFDAGDENSPAPELDYIELHPLGRVENCYRWAGETDVFEAIEDVCRRYRIDRDRIVLRGMSMGASGTWHLGLKHPGFFVALGPYSGYVDTHRFSETPGMNFVKVGPLPEVQELGLHMLDSVDYAANAADVPVIAAMGERDPFFQAHVIMNEAMRREGLEMVNLIAKGTGHVQDPATFAEQMRRIDTYATAGLNREPRHVRFVTWTLKYPRCHWIELLGLVHHYHRAEIDATIDANGDVRVKQPRNITRFALSVSSLVDRRGRLFIGDSQVGLPHETAPRIVVEKRGDRWIAITPDSKRLLTGKRPGLQGPIDDAFTTRFLCVRGTGKPWNPAVQRWADASLRRFAYEWSRYFVGDLPIKDDVAVTKDDCRGCNLILFGDPGSNVWIRRALKSLPIGWTRKELRFGADRCSSADHAPAMICPSPFAPRENSRYVVIDSGHTFHYADLDRLNYLLYPRLGDWAVIDVKSGQPDERFPEIHETVLRAGYFDESWRLDPHFDGAEPFSPKPTQ